MEVFSFEKTQGDDGSSSLSFATLDSKTSEELPPRFRWFKMQNVNKQQENDLENQSSRLLSYWPRFVLCWSHKQGAWDQRGVFHMYGNKEQPWLTIRLVKDEYLDFWKG